MRKIIALGCLVAVMFVAFAPIAAEAGMRLKVAVMCEATAKQVEVVRAWAGDRPELKFIRRAVNLLEEELQQRTETLNEKAKAEAQLKRDVEKLKAKVEELRKLCESEQRTHATTVSQLESLRAVNHGFSEELRIAEQHLGIAGRFEDGQSYCRVQAVERAYLDKLGPLESKNRLLEQANKDLQQRVDRQRQSILEQQAELNKLRAWCTLKAQALYLWETGQPDPNPTPRPAPAQPTVSSPAVPVQSSKGGPLLP